MNINKFIGYNALITKEGNLFGKQVAICMDLGNGKVLVSCDWYNPDSLTIIESKYLAIQLPPNKNE